MDKMNYVELIANEDTHPLVFAKLKEKRLTNNKSANDLLDNLEGLLKVGMPVSDAHLEYIKLALLENGNLK